MQNHPSPIGAIHAEIVAAGVARPLHLHVCATDGVFMPAVGGAGCCAPRAFLPVQPITQADLATITERVRRRVIRWFRRDHLLDAAAAADMLAWENSRFFIDASVRIALNRPRRVGMRPAVAPRGLL